MRKYLIKTIVNNELNLISHLNKHYSFFKDGGQLKPFRLAMSCMVGFRLNSLTL